MTHADTARTLSHAQHIAQHLAAKLLAHRKACAEPKQARYGVFIITPMGYIHSATISAPTLTDACRQFIRAWFSRTTTCAVVMRAPDGKRYRYAQALAVVEGGQ